MSEYSPFFKFLAIYVGTFVALNVTSYIRRKANMSPLPFKKGPGTKTELMLLPFMWGVVPKLIMFCEGFRLYCALLLGLICVVLTVFSWPASQKNWYEFDSLFSRKKEGVEEC